MKVLRTLGAMLAPLLFSTSAAMLSAGAQNVSPAVSVIPAPAHVSAQDGSLDLSHGLVFVPPGKDEDATWVVGYLQHLLATSGSPNALRQERTHGASVPELTFVHRPAQAAKDGGADESYALAISPSGVRITASGHAGYLYGAITLWQMMAHAATPLPAVVIEDEPRFRWRGLMLDSARHMQSEQFLLQLLDYMAEHKLNTFHWHLTDDQGWRIEIRRYPRLTSVGGFRPQTMPPYQPGSGAPEGPYGGFYTQQQIRRIVAYAKQRNINIVPEIEMPGHASAPIAAYPELGSSTTPLNGVPVGWGIFPNLYNVNETTFQFLENVLTEVMELFPGEYIHVGGDEAIKEQWKSNPAVQAKMHALGLQNDDQMQSWFMAQVGRFLKAHGRKMVGWDEILEGGLSPDATVMSWRGTQGAVSAARQNHDAILTPTRPLYFNYRQSGAIDEPPGRDPINSLADVYGFHVLPAGLTAAEQSHILGLQALIWSEYVITEGRIQHMLFPRLAAVAEVAWSPEESRSFDSFLHRLPADLQRTEDAGLTPAKSVFEVQARTTPQHNSSRADVALSTQAGFGSIHYTLDGSAVRDTSPVYREPLQVTLPAHLRAIAFDGATLLGSPIDHDLTISSALRRDSRELDPCTDTAGIQMEQDPPRNVQRPVFRVVYSHPCWIYRRADMDRIAAMTLGVGSIPFIFHSPNRAMPAPSNAPATDAHMDVHLDTCAGPLLAAIPLEPAYRKDGVTVLPAASIPAQSGTHDLCVSVENADPATVWLLNFIQPVVQ